MDPTEPGITRERLVAATADILRLARQVTRQQLREGLGCNDLDLIRAENLGLLVRMSRAEVFSTPGLRRDRVHYERKAVLMWLARGAGLPVEELVGLSTDEVPQ